VRGSIIKCLWWAGGLILAWGWGLAPLAAQTPGVQLIVSPQTVSFSRLPVKGPVAAAQQTVTVQVVAPPQRPWRLTVMARGPLQTATGKNIPINLVTWQGSPGSVFTNGTLSADRPQLLGQGQGPVVGTVRFFLKSSWNHATGSYNQGLTLELSSP